MRAPWTLAIFCLFCGGLVALPATATPSLEWHQVYDGGLQQGDVSTVALADADGNLVVGGMSVGLAGTVDMLIRKLDRDTGGTIWSHRQAAVDENDMDVSGMVWDGSGDLLIGGTRLGCFG